MAIRRALIALLTLSLLASNVVQPIVATFGGGRSDVALAVSCVPTVDPDAPDLHVGITATPAAPRIGQSFDLAYKVSNDGCAPADGVQFVADLPAGFTGGTVDPPIPPPGSCQNVAIPEPHVRCKIPLSTIEKLSSKTVTFGLFPDRAAAYTASGSVSTTTPEQHDCKLFTLGTCPAGDSDNTASLTFNAQPVVDTNLDGDDGSCSTTTKCTLREAINAANAMPNTKAGADQVFFDIKDAAPFTIKVSGSPLPVITEAIIIRGSSQPGWTAGRPVVELEGFDAPGAPGLRVGAGQVIVEGLVIGHFSEGGVAFKPGSDGSTLFGSWIGLNLAGAAAPNAVGVQVDASHVAVGSTGTSRNVISGNTNAGVVILGSFNIVRGNYIGLKPDGNAALANGGAGVRVESGSSNSIGDTGSGEGNVISGNGGDGVEILASASGNFLKQNLIGTNAAGTSAFGNGQHGAKVAGSSNIIGGASAEERNVISGNKRDGIYIGPETATSNLVRGNYIGTDITGTVAMTVAGQAGVYIEAPNNIVGGTLAAQRNVISGNDIGVFIPGSVTFDGLARGRQNTIQGNDIGLDANGGPLGNRSFGIEILGNDNTVGGGIAAAGNTIAHNGVGVVILRVATPGFAAATGNSILSNSILSNVGLGIDLGRDGVTGNDAGTETTAPDGDTGANNLQNFPNIYEVTTDGTNTTVSFTLETTPTTNVTVQFFDNAAADALGFGEGQTLIKELTFQTSTNGVVGSQVTVPTSVAPLGHFITATATATASPGNTSEFSKATKVVRSIDLDVMKFDAPDPVFGGQTLTYRIQVTNPNGTLTSSGFSLKDTLDPNVTFFGVAGPGTCSYDSVAHAVNCTVASVAPGDTVLFFIDVKPKAVATDTIVTNTVEVFPNDIDLNRANNKATTQTTVKPGADLSITKTDEPDPAYVQQELTYTLTGRNAGPTDATRVVIKDVLPAKVTFVGAAAGSAGVDCTFDALATPSQTVTCSVAGIASGSSVAIKIAVKPNTDAGTTAGSPIEDTATITGDQGDPDTRNNSATETTTVKSSADLAITKTGDPGTVLVGDLVTYTATVTNNGPSAATGVSVVDTLPRNFDFDGVSTEPPGKTCTLSSGTPTAVTCSIGELAAAQIAKVFITARPNAGAVGTATNVAKVDAADFDPNTQNNEASAVTVVKPKSDLKITKTGPQGSPPDATPVYVETEITYEVKATNLGPSAATGVTVTDTLEKGVTFVSATSDPAGAMCTSKMDAAPGLTTVTCPVGTLAKDAIATIFLKVRPTVDVGGKTITDTATVTATEFDPATTNNTATLKTKVDPVADLALTKTDSPDPAAVGKDLTYTVTVTNNGPSTATSVTLTDELPIDETKALLVTHVSTTPSQGTCAAPDAAGKIACDLGTLAKGATATVKIVVQPKKAGTPINKATAKAAEFDPDTTNNTATQDTTVQGIKILAKCGEDLLANADVLVYDGAGTLLKSFKTGADGTLSITGLPGLATYTVRFAGFVTKSFAGFPSPLTVKIRCGATLKLDADGNGRIDPLPAIKNLGNSSPFTAYDLDADPQNIVTKLPNGTYLLKDRIWLSGKKAWFKRAIAPSEKVSATATHPGLDITLYLAKDILKLFDHLSTAVDTAAALQELAALPADETGLGGDETGLGGDETGLGGDETGLGGDETGLGGDETGLGGDETGLGGDETGLGGPLPPDLLAPDAPPDLFTADEAAAKNYSIAFAKSLLCLASHVGTAKERCTRRTWTNDGSFYFAVGGYNGAFDDTRDFTLEIERTATGCTGVTYDTVYIPDRPASRPKSLFLTHSGRIDSRPDLLDPDSEHPLNSAEQKLFLDSLKAFAARLEIDGIVIDLNDPKYTQPGPIGTITLAEAYAKWDLEPTRTCALYVNLTIAPAITELINRYRDALTTVAGKHLEYVVLAAGDPALPAYRRLDLTDVPRANEANFDPLFRDDSSGQAQIRTPAYGSLWPHVTRRPIPGVNLDVFVPDVDHPVDPDPTISRIGETVESWYAQKKAYENTFLTRADGTKVYGTIVPTDAVCAGYGFNSDSTDITCGFFEQGGAKARKLIEPNPDKWTADDWRARVFDRQPDGTPGASKFQAHLWQAHCSHASCVAADEQTRYRATEIAADTSGRFEGTFVLSMGCHILKPSDYSWRRAGITKEIDWLQVLTARGATAIGAEGFNFGSQARPGLISVAYGESVVVKFGEELLFFDGPTPGPVPMGKALARATRRAIAEIPVIDRVTQKAAETMFLGGLAMMSVHFGQGRIPRPVVRTFATTGTNSPGLRRMDLTFKNMPVTDPTDLTNDLVDSGNELQYRFERHDSVMNLLPVTTPPTTVTTSYYDAHFKSTTGQSQVGTFVQPDQPIEPARAVIVTKPLDETGTVFETVVRDAVLLRSSFRDEADWRPSTDAVATQNAVPFAPAYRRVLGPVKPFARNPLGTLVVIPHQFRSNGRSSLGTGRRHDELVLGVYQMKWDVLRNASIDVRLAGAPTVYSVVVGKTACPASVNATPGATCLVVDSVIGEVTTVGVEAVYMTHTARPGTWTADLMTAVPGSRVERGGQFAQLYRGYIDVTGKLATAVDIFLQAVSGTGLVTWVTNRGQYFRFVEETSSLTAPRQSSQLALAVTGKPGTTRSETYRSVIEVTATLSGGTPPSRLADREISFTIGGVEASAFTSTDGVAIVQLPLDVLPGTHDIVGTFAGDAGTFGTTDAISGFRVERASTAFCKIGPLANCDVPPQATVEYSDSVDVARLTTTRNVWKGGLNTLRREPLGDQPILLELASSAPTRSIADVTAVPGGMAAVDTLDGPIGPNTFTATLRYFGNVRYAPTTSQPFALIVVPEDAKIDRFFNTHAAVGPTTFRSHMEQECSALFPQPCQDDSLGDRRLAQIRTDLHDKHPLVNRSATAIGSVALDGSSPSRPTGDGTATMQAGVYEVQGIVESFFTNGAAGEMLRSIDDPLTFTDGKASAGKGTLFTTASSVGVPADANTLYAFSFAHDQANLTTVSGAVSVKVTKQGQTLLAFESGSVRWHVVTPPAAPGAKGVIRAEGTGTLDGVQGYSYRIIATTGDAKSGATFEVHIWDATGTFTKAKVIISNALRSGSNFSQ